MNRQPKAIVLGVSTGGWQALNRTIPELPEHFPVPLITVQHMASSSDNFLVKTLDQASHLTVKEADEKETLNKGTVYIAPANYHLMVEKNMTLSLSTGQPVNFSRPSIDVLFETAADAFGASLIGVLLTGASKDGSLGMLRIKNRGGLTIVQDPKTAAAPLMPQSAIDLIEADYVTGLDELANLLVELTC